MAAICSFIILLPVLSGWQHLGGWFFPEPITTLATVLVIPAFWKLRKLTLSPISLIDLCIQSFGWIIVFEWSRDVWAYFRVETQNVQSFFSTPVWGHMSPAVGLSMGTYWLNGTVLGMCAVRLFSNGGRDLLRSGICLTWAVAMAFFAVLQQCLNWPWRYAQWIASAPFDDVHSFGSVALILLVFSCGQNSARRSGRTVVAVTVAFSLIALLASWSRSAWIACIVLGVLWVVRYCLNCGLMLALRRVTVPLLGITVALAVVLGLGSGNAFATKLRSLAHPVTMLEQNKERQTLWRIAIHIANEHPIIGVGMGRYFQNSATYDFDHHIVDKYNFAHNMYLQVAAELGYPAGFILLFLCVWALVDFFQDVHRYEAAAVGGYGITMLFNHPLILPVQILLFSFLLALWAARRRDRSL